MVCSAIVLWRAAGLLRSQVRPQGAEWGRIFMRRSTMANSESYGQGLAERLHLEQAPVILTRALRAAEMAVTATLCDVPMEEMSGSLPREDAFFVTLSLRDFPGREYWEEGRVVSVSDVR